ncbi:hypothetical protein FB45DRAFT_824856 [Roridomyces roridus]|uniref:Uncharacterized protein n=1 Tax=Roridomyces roridus TaxID=1738132 RepID=A0AAD7FV45_9AGAR|nr:hypothetical protein FB45DRAFT_824856 [Roridomyces roridus]
MPVSFTVANHPSNRLTPQGPFTAEDLLARACPNQYATASVVLGSSFSQAESLPLKAETSETGQKGPPTFTNIFPTPNGFVTTIISAYNTHHNLVIRPDDVWIDILTQFNFFVNANAELLRANFVAHDGKKELRIFTRKKREEMDFADLSRQMVDKLEENVVDPTLRAWVLPSFSTTTLKDKTVGAIVMMSTLKAYFEYVFESSICGIPRVTLAGKKSDWEDILQRLEKLKEYGIETIAWYHLLVPVIKRFVRGFDNPNAADNIDFWSKVADFIAHGSGQNYYAGWITAFCVFDPEGKWIGPPLKKSMPLFSSPSSLANSLLPQSPNVDPPESLSASAFWDTYGMPRHSGDSLVLDGTRFHMVETLNIPFGYVHVPVKLVDQEAADPEWSCVMVAGVVGMVGSSSGDAGKMDTVQPATGWWIFRKRDEE